MKKSNLILASALAIIFTSILIIFSPTFKKTPSSSLTTDWKTITIFPEPILNLASYQIDVPLDWKQVVDLSPDFQNLEIFLDKSTYDTSTYKLSIDQDKNINLDTGKAYASFKEMFTDFSYDTLPTLEINGISMTQVSPNDYSGSNYRVLFFSKDNKHTFSIELETPQDESKLEEGKILFNQILSTFKFTDAKTNSNKYDGCYDSKNATIKIETTTAGSTVLHGNATWENGYATGDDRFTVNQGTIDGILDTSDNKAHFYKDGCDIDFEFNQNIMVAKERKGSVCGGINVTFDGEYNLSNINSPPCSIF